jgi:hypothetical protein
MWLGYEDYTGFWPAATNMRTASAVRRRRWAVLAVDDLGESVEHERSPGGGLLP